MLRCVCCGFINLFYTIFYSRKTNELTLYEAFFYDKRTINKLLKYERKDLRHHEKFPPVHYCSKCYTPVNNSFVTKLVEEVSNQSAGDIR